MAHLLGIAGLAVNIFGSFLLLRFPPMVEQFTPDGAPIGGWSGKATPEGRRQYTVAKRGYPLGTSLLTLGFLLQLLDLLGA
jgi:hypothetical protein